MSLSGYAVRALALVAGAGVTASALAGGTITDGNATYTLVGNFDSNLGNGTFTTDTGGLDQLFQNNWYYRAAGQGMRVMSSLDSPTQSYVGDTATLFWNNTGTSGNRFDAQLVMKIVDGASPGSAQVIQTMTITNRNVGALTLNVFNLVDLDVSGTVSDNASLLAGDPTNIRFTDVSTSDYGDFRGFGANRYQIGTGSTLRNLLGGVGLVDLSNSGTASNADANGAFQWILTLGAGGSASFTSTFAINTVAVPTPGALALLGIAGVVGTRRRRA